MFNWQYCSIGSDNCLALNRWRAIIRTNGDLGIRRINASFSLNELCQAIHKVSYSVQSVAKCYLAAAVPFWSTIYARNYRCSRGRTMYLSFCRWTLEPLLLTVYQWLGHEEVIASHDTRWMLLLIHDIQFFFGGSNSVSKRKRPLWLFFSDEFNPNLSEPPLKFSAISANLCLNKFCSKSGL